MIARPEPRAWGDSQAAVYDALYPDNDGAACVEGLRTLIPLRCRVVDAGCGTGRLLEHFSRAGYDVSGIDASPAMLALARAKCPEARLHCCDLGQSPWWELVAPADCVLFAYNTLSMLHTRERQYHALAMAQHALTRNLNPFGLLVVQQFVPHESLLRPVDEDDGESRYVVEHDVAEQLLASRITMRDGRTFEQVHRYLYPEQLDELAQLAGFELLARWQNFKRDPFVGPPADECVAIYRPEFR